MNLDLRKQPSDSGAYSLVVFIEEKTKAVKIFSKSHEREQAKNVFNSEVKAYELASKDTGASLITPTFFGKHSVEKIIDANGNDITNQYFTDLVYILSYEIGLFLKYSVIPETEQNLIKNTLKPLGINYLIDCSVSLTPNNKVSFVIDFATEEFEIWA